MNSNNSVYLCWKNKSANNQNIIPCQNFKIIESIDTNSIEGLHNQLKWNNKLILGDNLVVMNSLIENFSGKIDLIYIDPPFATGRIFKTKKDEFAYSDNFGGDLSDFLQMMYDRLIIMRKLLSDNGSIYIHVDYRVQAYIKIMMDEIFSPNNFINEIIWCYTGASSTKSKFLQKHNVIFSYSKTKNYIFNWQDVSIPYSKETVDRTQRNAGTSKFYKGDIELRHKNRLKQNGKIPEDWWIDIYRVQGNSIEKIDYPTQKPESLLTRIIKVGSNKESLVADFFCGSGTTAVVAEKLGRRWITTDNGQCAINTAKGRMLELKNHKPFDILKI